MQFLFNLFNHTEIGQTSLHDPMSIIGHQLQALGHHVVWVQKNDQFVAEDSGLNFVMEGFTPHSIQVLAEVYARGGRFVCIATEEPTPEGFNHGESKEMVQRQEDFRVAAQFFNGILYLVPGDHVRNWYSQFAPSAYVELGHAPTLERNDYSEPTHEFGFFGSLTKRRYKILKQLARRAGITEKGVRVESTFPGQEQRDKVMREAKVIVQIRKSDKMGLVSSSRCNTALHLGRPVVAEPHELSKPWDEVVRFTQTLDEFYSAAEMARINWKSVHYYQFQKFKEKFTPEFCVGRALREIGVLPSVGSVAA